MVGGLLETHERSRDYNRQVVVVQRHQFTFYATLPIQAVKLDVEIA